MDIAEKRQRIIKTNIAKPRFRQYFKATMKAAVAIPLILAIGFAGYLGITGTAQEFRNGRGVYRLDINGNRAKVVLPSFVEWRENREKMNKVSLEAINSFNLKNPKVVRALSGVEVIVAPSSEKNKDAEVYYVQENKIYFFSTANERLVRHAGIHIYHFKEASPEENAAIAKTMAEAYSWFPEKFGKYVRDELRRTNGDIVSVMDGISKRFNISEKEMLDIEDVFCVWFMLYAFSETYGSIGTGKLNARTITEMYSYFGEREIPEPFVNLYKDVLNERAHSAVNKLSPSTIKNAQTVFEAKMEPYL